jgi:hypothetical protein
MFKKQTMYESDHTKFIKELKEKTPGMEQRQQEGRALLWDTAPLSAGRTAPRGRVAPAPASLPVPEQGLSKT